MAIPAYWASWADCMPMIFSTGRSFGSCSRSPSGSDWCVWFDPPTWEALAAGARPPIMEPEEMEPGGGRGWQHAAASKVEHQHREEWFVHMRPSHRAQVRSQAGPGAGMALSSAPVNFLTRIPPHLFRVVLLRRLRLPLPLSLHTCRCGRQIDKFGHRASCARAGVLGRRGFALESATARVCREAGGRVTTNIMVRWTLLNQGPQTDADLRWLWMASPCLGDGS